MGAAIVRHGVFLDGRACLLVWQVLRGLPLPPEVAAAKEAMSLAASEHLAAQAMSAGGPITRTSADLAPGLNNDRSAGFTATELGDQLFVTSRHVRRVAIKHGVVPVQTNPYRWDEAGAAVIRDHLHAA